MSGPVDWTVVGPKLATCLNHVLSTSGARGHYYPIEYSEAVKKAEAQLAALCAPQAVSL